MISVLMFVIGTFIAYKCCEKFEFKVTWAIYMALNLVNYIIRNGFSGIFIALIVSGIICAIEVYIYYAIYARTSSFLSFMLLSILIVGGVTIGLVLILGLIIYGLTANSISATGWM